MLEEQSIYEDGLEGLGRYYSMYRGIVYDRKDPEKLGRIMVKIPELFDDQVHEYWCYPSQQVLGNKIGLFVIPNVGDYVWVQFEGGDITLPIWSGGHWVKGEQLADLYDDTGEPTRMIWISTTGNKIILDDKEKKLYLTDPHGHETLLNEWGISFKSTKISLGKIDGSAEPGVLGDTLKNLLQELIDEIKKITVMTAMGQSSVPLNIAQFTAIAGKLETILSKVVTLD